tara:strand:+ start:365 stop:982 length:618 start_codon:yes stop_codon:yes gene_type:complete
MTEEITETSADQAQLKVLTNSFQDNLVKLDEAKGTNLAEQFRECMRFHDENVLLRQNILQMNAVLQDQYDTEIKMRTKLSEYLEGLDPNVDGFLEAYNQITALQAKSTAIINRLNITITNMKKEIRATEFQSQFIMHMSLFTSFVTSLQGILFKHLQSSPRLEDIAREITHLARQIGFMGGSIPSGIEDVTDDVEVATRAKEKGR